MIKDFWIGLLIGLIVGWVVEWIIDWVYWRKKFGIMESQLEETKDDLKVIKGIGKIIENRLNKAGVYTFKSLSKLDQPAVEKIVGNAKNLSDEEGLIKQAKKLAKKKGK